MRITDDIRITGEEIINSWLAIEESARNEEALESIFHDANCACSQNTIMTIKSGKTDGFLVDRENQTKVLSLVETKIHAIGKNTACNRRRILCQLLAYLVNTYGDTIIPFRRICIATDTCLSHISISDIEPLYEAFKTLYRNVRGTTRLNSKGNPVKLSASNIYNKQLCPEIVRLFNFDLEQFFTVYSLNNVIYNDFLRELLAA